MPYHFGLLNSHLSPDHPTNARWLHPYTLGIEVTNFAFAKLCGLGNINHQHTKEEGPAAITVALTWPLPLDGTDFVTIREDKDAIGAMAVFLLRFGGLSDKIDRWMIAWIDAIDTHGFKEACRNFPDLEERFLFGKEFEAMDIVVHDKSGFWPFEKKVFSVAKFLCHDVSSEEIASIIARKPERKRMDFTAMVEKYGEVAFIDAPDMYHQARSWGSENFPVTIVSDPLLCRHTIVRQSGFFDRRGAEEALNMAEARSRGLEVKELLEKGLSWGGNHSIISFRGTTLDKATILMIVYDHLESGIVT